MKHILLIIPFVLLTICSCGVETRYKVLSFFFDGVPLPPSLPSQEAIQPDTSITSNLEQQKEGPDSPRFTREKTVLFIHPPFARKQCNVCHLTQFGNKLVKPATILCYDCHQAFAQLPGYVHGPVVVGDCIMCHNPHSSPYPYLVIRAGDDLCTFCHIRVDQTITREHNKIGEMGCIPCHDPHFSEDSPFFLKQKAD